MPKIVREDIDNLNAVLTVTIEQNDYKTKFIDELKKYKEKAHMKGFRKGKTPLSFVKKMYGKQVLSQIVTEMMQNEVIEYLDKEDAIRFLGQPIPNENQELIDFDPKELDDYEFKFDVGKAPTFEVKGASETDEFEITLVEVTDDMVDESMAGARKQGGERIFSEEEILEEDLVKLSVKELDGGVVKEDGRTSEFSIFVEKVVNEDTKKELLAKKKGDTLHLNVFELEDVDEDHVKKYFLGMEAEEMDTKVGADYEATIIEVSRVKLGEMDQAFFDKAFGEGIVSSEEEARAHIKEEISKQYRTQSESILFREIREELMAKNQEEIQLPNEFMKRWLKISSKENTEELVNRDYPNFAENLKWSLIKGDLAKRFEVKVSEAEVINELENRVRGYLRGMGGEEYVKQTVERLLEEPGRAEQVQEELMDSQLFKALMENLVINEKTVSFDDFKAIVDDINKKEEEKRAEKAALEAAEEEE